MLATNLENSLHAITQSKPELVAEQDGFTIYLERPNALIAGDVGQYDGKSSVHLTQFEVHDQIAYRGIGSRLLEVFLRYCDSENTAVITSEITSSSAMHIRRRVVGEEVLHFTEQVDGHEVELPMSVDRACMSIERAWDHWKEARLKGEDTSFSVGIDTKIYLTDIDSSSWEMPVPSK